MDCGVWICTSVDQCMWISSVDQGAWIRGDQVHKCIDQVCGSWRVDGVRIDHVCVWIRACGSGGSWEECLRDRRRLTWQQPVSLQVHRVLCQHAIHVESREEARVQREKFLTHRDHMGQDDGGGGDGTASLVCFQVQRAAARTPFIFFARNPLRFKYGARFLTGRSHALSRVASVFGIE